MRTGSGLVDREHATCTSARNASRSSTVIAPDSLIVPPRCRGPQRASPYRLAVVVSRGRARPRGRRPPPPATGSGAGAGAPACSGASAARAGSQMTTPATATSTIAAATSDARWRPPMKLWCAAATICAAERRARGLSSRPHRPRGPTESRAARDEGRRNLARERATRDPGRNATTGSNRAPRRRPRRRPGASCRSSPSRRRPSRAGANP